ncbi:MAG: xylulokinase [Candidatus Atribacteria bacterium]|nr:xylulokinase [Candidatus Atribacteria bacterium]
MEKYLLGIDIGTSGCKCSVINDQGKMIASSSQEYVPFSPQPGWMEQDPFDWYHALILALRKLQNESAIDLKNIIALAPTGQMRGLTFIGKKGEVVRNSILWNDLRCQEEVNHINSSSRTLVEEITGNPINTMCTLPKILWVMKNQQELWEKTNKIIYPKDFISYQLTGNIQTDHSDGSGSSFYDIRKQEWSPVILELFGISRGKLPELYLSTAMVGKVTRMAAYDTGLLEGIPVMAGGSDSTVETISIGIIGPHQCKIRLGTSGALSTVVNTIENRHKYYYWSYLVPKHWMIDLNTRSCAQSVQWLRKVFFSELPSESISYHHIEEEARQSPLGSQGLIFHPYLMGEDAPYWDPILQGNFSGITIEHNRSDFARAVYEGTAFALKDAMSCFGNISNGFQQYIFVGGGTRNLLWLSIVADVLGVNGIIPPYSDASYGAALIAGIGSGVFNSLSYITHKFVTFNKIEYSKYNNTIYNNIYEIYKSKIM